MESCILLGLFCDGTYKGQFLYRPFFVAGNGVAGTIYQLGVEVGSAGDAHGHIHAGPCVVKERVEPICIASVSGVSALG